MNMKCLENTQVRSKRIEKVGCKKIIDCQTEVNYEDNDKDDDRAQGRDDDDDVGIERARACSVFR